MRNFYQTFSYAMDDANSDPNVPDYTRVSRFVLEKYGIKPRFIKSEEQDLMIRVLEPISGYGNFNFSSTLFSLFPKIDVKPVPREYATRSNCIENIGFLTLNPFQFLIRADLPNVRSCHAVARGDYRAGNLGYLTNPFWACIGVYTNEDSIITKCDINDITPEDIDLPNLLATFNALLCFNAQGQPSVAISRFYGNTYINKIRILEYFTDILGLHVYAIDSVSSYWDALDAFKNDQAGYKGHKELESAGPTLLASAPIPAQIWASNCLECVTYRKDTEEADIVPYRYPDIAASRGFMVGSTLYVQEVQQGYLIAEANAGCSLGATWARHAKNSMDYATLKHTSEARQKTIFDSKHTDPRVVTYGCGHRQLPTRDRVVTEYGSNRTICPGCAINYVYVERYDAYVYFDDIIRYFDHNLEVQTVSRKDTELNKELVKLSKPVVPASGDVNVRFAHKSVASRFKVWSSAVGWYYVTTIASDDQYKIVGKVEEDGEEVLCAVTNTIYERLKNGIDTYLISNATEAFSSKGLTLPTAS